MGLLADVLVMNLRRALAVPRTATMLGDLGSQVIEVDSRVGLLHVMQRNWAVGGLGLP